MIQVTPEILRQRLEKQYELICFVDLADISESPGKIYSLLEQHYRPEFQAHQRLIFYTDCEIPIDLLTHINEACLHIDISSSFILICSKIDHSQDISRIFGSEDFPNNLLVSVVSRNLSDKYHYPRTICPLPWMHLAAMHQGRIQPCCINNSFIGHVKNHSLEETFNGSFMQRLRQEFWEGKKPISCSHCWNTESRSDRSSRQILLEKYKTKFLDEWLSDIKLRSLDLKAGNTCNFKCRICNPVSSVLIANEQLNLLSDQTRIEALERTINDGKWFDDDSLVVLDEIVKLSQDLISINFCGGEPLLLKSLDKLLKKIIDAGYANQIRIQINSNGSIFPKNIIDDLSHFKQVNIRLSIDDIGARFEYQRGGSWAEIENNLEKYKSLVSDRFELSMCLIINIQNVYYIDELLDWAALNQIPVVAEYLEYPFWLSISYLTEQAKQLIIDKFQDHEHPLIQSIVSKIKISPGSTGEKFCAEMIKLDLHRNQKFPDHHDEIAIAMGYSV